MNRNAPVVRRSRAAVREPPGKPCAFPDCGRDVYALKLCHAHREQLRRGQRLRPLRCQPGEGTAVRIRCTRAFKADVERAAALEGVNPSEFWRQKVEAATVRTLRKHRP